MEYMNLGASGLKVSRVSVGTACFGSTKWQAWAVGEAEARKVFKTALDLGINFFDTANNYSRGEAEQITGNVLKDLVPRDQVVVTSKVCGRMGDGPNEEGLSRKHIMDSIDASLKRLQMDYVDLYVIHRFDSETPVEETLEALTDVVKAGKARYIGASSMAAYQLARLYFTAAMGGWSQFIAMQGLYNLLYREEEREMNRFCVEQGIGLIPWSPMARGFFALRKSDNDAVRRDSDQKAKDLFYRDVDHAIADRVDELAGKHGVSASQIALAWILHKPGVVSPVVGAPKPEYIEAAVAALDIRLDESEMAYLEELYETRPVYGFEPEGRGA